MKILIDGKGMLTVDDSNIIASGGEGTVYRIGSYVAKVYHDASHTRDVESKLPYFSRFDLDTIVRPLGIVRGSDSRPIGIYMNYVSGTQIVRYFTSAYRDKIGFGTRETISLVDSMYDIVEYAHNMDAVMIDANELGYLVNGTTASIIDVDSWVVDGNIPSTVMVMPSIRDYHHEFGYASDWYSYGIVTFQLFTGIHPYSGRLDGYRKDDIEGRMKANASVFLSNVKLNKSVRDLRDIPAPLYDWYKYIFQSDRREVPPRPTLTGKVDTTINRVSHTIVKSSGKLVIEKLLDVTNDKIVMVYQCGIVRASSGKLVEIHSRRVILDNSSLDTEVVSVEGGYLVYSGSKFTYIGQSGSIDVVSPVHGRVITYSNRMFTITDSSIVELSLDIVGKRAILSISNSRDIMSNSTRWYNGVGVQNTIGAAYVIVAYDGTMYDSVRVRELDEITVVDARGNGRFVSLVCIGRDGKYRKVEVYIGKDIPIVRIYDTDDPTLNISILDRGICATIVEDGRLTIFNPSNNTSTSVDDSVLNTNMYLYNVWDKVMYVENGVLYSMKLS